MLQTIPEAEIDDDLTTASASNRPFRVQAASGTGTTIAFPGFDKNKIDVAGFPDYVQRLIGSSTSFVFMIVTSNKVYFWAADCCTPAVSSTNGNLFIIDWSRSTHKATVGNKVIQGNLYPDFFGKSWFSPEYKACYSATYSWSSSATEYSIVSDWAVANSKSFAAYDEDTNTALESGNSWYTYNIPGSLSKVTTDFYVFGNFNQEVFSSHLANPYWFGIKNGYFEAFFEERSSFISSFNLNIDLYSNHASEFSLIDGGSFPTAQSQQNETQRGILGQLKALPDKIKGFFTTLSNNIKGFFTSLGDRISGFFDNLFTKIKGLFIPSDGFFDTYFSDLKTFFAERFGFIYDLPAAVITILNKLINYTPAESGYHIHFPEVSTPVISNGTLSWHKIIDEQDYYFDFLSNAPFSTLYSGYRAFVWLAYCFMLINLAKSKAENIFGGK